MAGEVSNKASGRLGMFRLEWTQRALDDLLPEVEKKGYSNFQDIV
jgi:hypothetical protein